MVYFFGNTNTTVFALSVQKQLDNTTLQRLKWLFGGAEIINTNSIDTSFIGPRKEMITPWSTNAVEIAQNMGMTDIIRIEQFKATAAFGEEYDPMLEDKYETLDQHIFTIDRPREPVYFIDDIGQYNESEGLALSKEEVTYLENLSEKLGRKLTDSEVFGFSQVNSEHCRHKIFNGTFIIDGEKMPASLFSLIKQTTKKHPNQVISAYKDNVAFLKGPEIQQFAPARQNVADFFSTSKINSILSLKAETHNFPTTVEPFNGASTGTGGEIRDRLGGGKGSLPLAGTAVYMTSYPRLNANRTWEKYTEPREWLYQNPEEILIKASNGASDFGNKFGQPLIAGSVLTYEYQGEDKQFGYDKVIMLAGGIGYAKKEDTQKETPRKGEKIILLGGDNYRIGMGGSSVSSVNTGEYNNSIELNAVQRANPEMQKRVTNAIRALAENTNNPIISIHDHGAGGHLNALSELVEEAGGRIDLQKLPKGDPTLSAKEIIGNESQERMGLILKPEDVETLKKIAQRERAPMYVIGEITGDYRFTFEDTENGEKPINLHLSDMFGNPPELILRDETTPHRFKTIKYQNDNFENYLFDVLQLEAVACKDWLTNKVDRSVTGKVACQQTTGELQLPLNNLGVSALDYTGTSGLATAIGHAPVSGLIDPAAASRLSVAEALTNIVWTPLKDGLQTISLSANWMWPAKNTGENARLYTAVDAISNFSQELEINISTGKDSLSMTQKYPDGKTVYAPGTVIVSAAGEVSDITKTVTPDLKNHPGSTLIYIPFSKNSFELGGSSFAQAANQIGDKTPDVSEPEYFKNAFNAVQELVNNSLLLAGHDIGSGGLITTLIEMAFPDNITGIDVNLNNISAEKNSIKTAFNENPGVVIQVRDVSTVTKILNDYNISWFTIGTVNQTNRCHLKLDANEYNLSLNELRDKWYLTSYLLDTNQSGEQQALKRYRNYKQQPLHFNFPDSFTGKLKEYGLTHFREYNSGITAAIIREKGVNGDREMAYSLYFAGFDVKDVHMTDLINGKEDLSDVNMIVFVGGFSNSDVLGSARGWAGAFLYNPKAKKALDDFYNRPDTMSLGVCNGCQLMTELQLITPGHTKHPTMQKNDSEKFESAFVAVDIEDTNAIMLKTLSNTRLGVWISHGEGKFYLPSDESNYNIPVRYTYKEYPGNPNGSDYNAAALCSGDGRHLAIMPHPERSIFSWQWPHYPENRQHDEITPWTEAFINAKRWIAGK